MAYPEHYRELMCTEIQAFVDRTESFAPEGDPPFTLEEQRLSYGNLCKAFHAGYPNGVTSTGVDIGLSHSVPIRIYSCSEANNASTVVYFHGGGFVLGGLDSHDDVCAEICAYSGFRVVSVDYRLSPENPFPADFEDAMYATHWVRSEFGGTIVLSGDSAGGCLAAAVAARCSEFEDAIVGQVLIYPTLGGDMQKGSYLEHADAPILTLEGMEYYNDCRTGNSDHSSNADFFPLRASRFDQLPPTVSISADLDPLRDDSRDYCEQIVLAGGKAHWINEPGLVHGYLRARHSVECARASFARITGAIAMLGSQSWKY